MLKGFWRKYNHLMILEGETTSLLPRLVVWRAPHLLWHELDFVFKGISGRCGGILPSVPGGRGRQTSTGPQLVSLWYLGIPLKYTLRKCPIPIETTLSYKQMSVAFQWNMLSTGEQINSTLYLWHLQLFSFQNTVNGSKHLESHIKVITQLEKPIGINYSNNLPDGKSFSPLGGSEFEYPTKDQFNSLRKWA